MRRGVVLVAVSFTLAACASVPSAPPELQVVALSFTPTPGKARIYVYRAGGMFGSASRLSVAIDSQIVGRTAPDTYLMVDLEPGLHRVSAPTGENESSVPINAVADSIYFVKLWPKMGFLSAHSGMELMDPAAGRAGISTARLVVSTWPGRPM